MFGNGKYGVNFAIGVANGVENNLSDRLAKTLDIYKYMQRKKYEFIKSRLGNVIKTNIVSDDDLIKILLIDDSFILEKGDIILETNSCSDLKGFTYARILRGKEIMDYICEKYKCNIDFILEQWEEKMINEMP